MRSLWTLWLTILTPSPRREDGYTWALIAIGHVMLGAAVAGLADGWGNAMPLAARLALSVGYWLIKERGDLRRGGAMADGIGDAAWVGYGLLYVGPAWWPTAAMLGAAIGALLRQRSLEGADA